MKRIGDLAPGEFAAILRHDGLQLDLGAASIRAFTDVASLAPALRRLYAAFPLAAPPLHDLTVTLRQVPGRRRWLRPQVELVVDGARDFEPFARAQALPQLEWGLNYGLASRLTCYLLLHAGALEHRGRALLLSALPGSGKSTLTAALSLRGLRLLSDEFGVLDLNRVHLLPMLRPVALKNASIDLIAARGGSARLGPRTDGTHKGTVAHLAPCAADVDACRQPARPAVIVFPRYLPASPLSLQPVPRARAFARLAVNSFNYDALGPQGFDALGALVAASRCYEMQCGDLDAAVDALVRLLDDPLSDQPTPADALTAA